MRKILIDTNIVLDLALEREGFVGNAIELLKTTSKNKSILCVTATTVTDIYYLLRKQQGHDKAIGYLKKFFKFTDILSVDKEALLNAIYSGRKDFEDATQIETAKQNNISVVITRNKKDFVNSDLDIYAPDEYINKIQNG